MDDLPFVAIGFELARHGARLAQRQLLLRPAGIVEIDQRDRVAGGCRRRRSASARGPSAARACRTGSGRRSRCARSATASSARRAHPLDRSRSADGRARSIDPASMPSLASSLATLRPDALQRLDLGEQGIEDFGPHRADPSQKRARLPTWAAWHLRRFRAGGPDCALEGLTDGRAPARLQYRAHHRGTREADFMIGGFFDAHHAAWGAARARTGSRRCSTSRTSTSWPGRSEPPRRPERFRGPMLDALQKLDFIKVAQMSEPLQRSPQGRRAADPGRRAGGLPAVAGGRSGARGARDRRGRPRGGRLPPTKRRCARWPKPRRCSRPRSRC